MKLQSILVTLLLTVALAYYIYRPIPDAIQEPWKLMLADAGFRTFTHVALVLEWLGFGHHIHLVKTQIEGIEGLAYLLAGQIPSVFPTVGADVRVTDTAFDSVPVRIYEPPVGGEVQLRRAVLFLHGGGWALHSARGKGVYDSIALLMSDQLNAVVVSVEYRLYPWVQFPTQYLDCLSAAKHFLSPEILAHYSVDPQRVAVSGDSAGGNLAAAIAQEISTDDSVSVKFSVQALIYPVLQALDFHTPSYQQNHNGPIVLRSTMVQYWLNYLGADPALHPVLMANNHSSLQQSAITPEMRARVDWTVLLPPKHRKNYKPVVVEMGRAVVKEVPGLLDVRAMPLLAEPAILEKCPRAYIVTCEIDILRDDGLMYGRRLQDAGVTVTIDHYDDAFHGCLNFSFWPSYFEVGRRVLMGYINWLQDNL